MINMNNEFFQKIDYLISDWTERLQFNHVFIELEIEFSKEQFYPALTGSKTPTSRLREKRRR